MFEEVLVTGVNDETLLPRVLRVLAKQGAQVRSLNMAAEKDTMKVTIRLAETAALQVAKLLEKQISVMSVETRA
ncbi:MAG: hypothetical protein SPI71_07005 [Acidaminococcaceae bacterium]|nr:hypothetical protein [Acidaminococcaceae bacterium]